MSRVLVNRPVIAAILTAAVTFAVVTLAEFLYAPLGQQWIGEGAWIESVSAGLWFAGGLLGFATAYRRANLRIDFALLGWVLIILGFRELDFHTRFTPWNMGHLVKYTKDFIPLSIRLTGIIFVLLPMFAAVGFAMTRWRRHFVAAWSERKTWTMGIVWWIAFLMTARVADKLTGRPGFLLDADDTWLFRTVEESLELGLALLTVLLVFHALHVSERDAHEGASAGISVP